METGKKRLTAIIRTVLIIICIFGAVISSFKIYEYLKEKETYKRSEEELEDYVSSETEKTVVIPVVGPKKEEEGQEQLSYRDLEIDFASLTAENPDIIGWIYIPGTDISYPVVKGKDNTEYLTHDALKRKSSHGAIFMDSSNRADLSDMKMVVYGHRMNDGTMFGSLSAFSSQEYYESHSWLIMYVPGKAYVFRIAGACEIKADAGLFRVFHEDTEEYAADIKELLKGSLIDGEYTVSEGQKTLVLSTCVKHKSDRRFILVCALEGQVE